MTNSMPGLEDLSYHPDKLPKDTHSLVELLAEIVGFDMEPRTKRDEYTLNVLCGVVLYRHLDRLQKMNVISMIRDSEGHIDKADLFELISFCVDPLVQPRWHLWSLTTNELEIIYKDQENMAKLLATMGVGFTFSGAVDVWKAGKSVSKGLPVFLVGSTVAYIQSNQLSNTKNELDRRTSNPNSSSYFQ